MWIPSSVLSWQAVPEEASIDLAMMARQRLAWASTDTGATPLAASLDPSDPAILDYETLDDLRLLDRVKPGLLDQLMERFEAKRQGQLAALEQAMADQRWPEVKTLAHSLKGGAGSIGLIALSRLAAQLESDPQSLILNPALLGTLDRAMNEGMRALRAWRDG